MTAQTMHHAGAERPTAQPTARESAPEARWQSYVTAHRPAMRRHARRDLARGALGALAVAAFVSCAGLGVWALPADLGHALAGTLVFGIITAFVAVSVWAVRRRG